jgi:hypothetical protein
VRVTEQHREAMRRNVVMAIKARKRNTALERARDPAALDAAARTVRAAIELGLLTKADLDGPIVPETAQVS